MKYEAIIWDRRDVDKAELSSTLLWYETVDNAIDAICEYMDIHGEVIYKWEIHDRNGNVVDSWSE